jgi:hypothetical protein
MTYFIILESGILTLFSAAFIFVSNSLQELAVHEALDVLTTPAATQNPPLVATPKSPT